MKKSPRSNIVTMHRTTVTSFLVILLITVSVAISFAAERNFKAHLSGKEEVPPVATKAQGQAHFKLSKDGTKLEFKLNVANIENVTAAHIHLAPKGDNGPVVVTLFSGPTTEGKTTGTLAEGTITAADLVGPLAGKPLSDLIKQMEAGNTYVNVHTTQHPAGEIRGQIR